MGHLKHILYIWFIFFHLRIFNLPRWFCNWLSVTKQPKNPDFFPCLSVSRNNFVFLPFLIWNMKDMKHWHYPRISGSSQHSSPDKIFPPLRVTTQTHPWLFVQITNHLKIKGGAWGGCLETLVLVNQTKQIGLSYVVWQEHSRFTCSFTAPALFTFSWNGDLEVFGSALHSLGTIRQFTF